MEVYGVIYLLIDGTNDKEYVGQTIRTFEERFKGHLHGDQYVDRVIRKRGADMFATAILKVCYSQEELDYWERHFIKYRNTMAPNGYNVTAGGEGLRDFHHTEETKAKISATMTGTKQTDEHRANSSAAQQKRYEDPAEHEKASAAQRKRYEDPAERAKTAAALKKSRAENPLSPESHAQQAESLRKFYDEHPEVRQHLADLANKQFESEEARKAHSELMIRYYEEHPMSAETLAKKSAAQKARQARLRIARMPEMIAKQNLAAAKWESFHIDLENFPHEHPDDLKKLFEDAKLLKKRWHQAKYRAKKRLLRIAESNLAAANLPAKINLSTIRP